MTNSQVESSAVGSVKNVLNDTGYIDASDIKERDKFPIWDGHILVRSSDTTEKKDMIHYKIPVQVKGITSLDTNLKYPIEVNDLKKFLNDDGVLYFVVFVKNQRNSRENEIFYIDLLPDNIKKILKNKETQQTIDVPLKKLPSQQEELVNLVFNFGLNRSKQSHLISCENISITDFDKICLHYASPFKITQTDILLNFEGYCYGYKNDIPYPFMEVPKGGISQISRIPQKISINGVDFFEYFKLKQNVNSLSIVLNNNIEIIHNINDEKTKCYFLLKGTLSNYIKSAKFLLDVHKNGCFYIGEHKNEISFDIKNITELEEKFAYFGTLKEALDKSGVSEDIELSTFNEKDLKNTSFLINAFVYGNDLELKSTQKGLVVNFYILGKTITCLAYHTENGKYHFSKFPMTGIATTDRNGKKIKIPPFLMLKKEHLKNSLNIHFLHFLDEIKKYPISEDYLDIVNSFLLELLNAYDEVQKEDILNTSENIAKWLVETTTDKQSSIIYHLNFFQCKIRKQQDLLETEKDYLYNLSEKSDKILFKCVASILLKEQDRAKRFFYKLPMEEQNQILNFPINQLWKDLSNG